MGERVEHEPATALLSMPLRQSVAVVMERTPLASRWQSGRWEAKGVVPDIFRQVCATALLSTTTVSASKFSFRGSTSP